jgi:hypothetical protein
MQKGFFVFVREQKVYFRDEARKQKTQTLKRFGFFELKLLLDQLQLIQSRKKDLSGF